MGKLTNVACKLPSGMLISHGTLAMQDGKPKIDPRTSLAVVENERTVRLYGSLHKDNPDKEEPMFGGNVGGFGITQGVDADWFADWVLTHENYLPALQEGMIFALENPKDVQAKAKNDRSLKSGLQPLDVSSKEGDERVPEARDLLDKADRS